jgi:AcrR family transcriptional regulator
MSTTDPRSLVARAARKHQRARLELDTQIREARALGVSVQEIARLVGVSRPTVYAILRD